MDRINLKSERRRFFMAYKKILTIQDISCVGQCSLTVALPIISACGIETAVLPSAENIIFKRPFFAMCCSCNINSSGLIVSVN